MDIFKFFLILHIFFGSIGLLAGTYNMAAKKGDKLHKLIGKIFAISMLGAGFSSLLLAILHRNDFLLAVGIFTIYLTATGWRYLYLKNIIEGQKPLIIDWIIMVFMALGIVVFVTIGTKSILDKNYFGIIIFAFAWRGITFVIHDFKTYQGKIKEKNYWLIAHLQRMSSAYIASLTAFVVVNAPNKFSFVPWLLPAAIFVPFIIKWTRKYTFEKSK
jgi:uncharacterized membrane protein